MSYTRSQLHERISDLSGQYRAAQENKRLTSQKRAEDERLADLARQADEKADGHLIEIAAQIQDAKAQYAAAVDEFIAPTGAVLGDGGSSGMTREEAEAALAEANAVDRFPSIFTEGADLHSQLLARSEEKMNGAFDQATQ